MTMLFICLGFFIGNIFGILYYKHSAKKQRERDEEILDALRTSGWTITKHKEDIDFEKSTSYLLNGKDLIPANATLITGNIKDLPDNLHHIDFSRVLPIDLNQCAKQVDWNNTHEVSKFIDSAKQLY